MRATECLLGKSELIEKESGKDYLRVVLLDSKVIGGQAIGKYADDIGLLIGAMWRKDDIDGLRSKMEQDSEIRRRVFVAAYPAGSADWICSLRMNRFAQGGFSHYLLSSLIPTVLRHSSPQFFLWHPGLETEGSVNNSTRWTDR